MKSLSNENLLDSYYQAIKMKLSPAFISLLRLEIERREIKIWGKISS